MKITYESENNKCSITDRDDLDIYDIINVVERLLLAIGYHPDSVKAGFQEKGEGNEEN